MGGQSCSWRMTRRLDQCVGCMVPWNAFHEVQHPQEGRVDSFSVSPKGKIIGSTKAHVENKGINHRWAVEETNEVYCPTSEGRRLVDVHLIGVHRIHQEGTLREVGHVKAHRSKQEKLEMTLFEKMITEGNM